MHVVQQKDAIAESRQGLFHLLPVEFLSAARGDAFEPFDHARFVAFSLQTTNEPSARVRQPFVIKVDGVLGYEHYTESERATLFQQRQQRKFRRRIRYRRKVSKDFIQIGRASCRE